MLFLFVFLVSPWGARFGGGSACAGALRFRFGGGCSLLLAFRAFGGRSSVLSEVFSRFLLFGAWVHSVSASCFACSQGRSVPQRVQTARSRRPNVFFMMVWGRLAAFNVCARTPGVSTQMVSSMAWFFKRLSRPKSMLQFLQRTRSGLPFASEFSFKRKNV